MLEKPELPDETIRICLQRDYGLRIAQLTFLPIGADVNTAVYCAVTVDEVAYFVKVRRGPFDEITATLPKWLSDQGIPQIIAPLAAQTGQLWANLDNFTLLLYPFVVGQDGYTVPLTDRQWGEFGRALKRLHTARLPPALTQDIPQETYAPQARATVKAFLTQLADGTWTDPLAVQLAAFLQPKQAEVLALVARTERLAQHLQAQTPPLVVCHTDLHAGNFHITPDGKLYIVDWDNLLLAPKERDLMYVGGGLVNNWRTPQAEAALFYQGYGPTAIDPVALAYYRYERIIQDLALECEQLFLNQGSDADRAQAFHFLQSNFLPNSVLQLAYQADQTGIV